MHQLEIEQFESHFRLPASRLAVRNRLETVTTQLLESALPQAVERAGLQNNEILCIREIRVPVHLQMSETDDELAARWADELLSRIRSATVRPFDAAREHQTEVVRYATREEVLLDFAVGLMTGQHTRAWAWKQVGIAGCNGSSMTESVAEQFTAALCIEPASIVSVIRQLARRSLLQVISDRLEPVHWHRLASAASRPFGVEVASQSLRELPSTDSSTPCSDGARRVLSRSTIARAACNVKRLLPDSSSTLALLSILESEPALLLQRADERTLTVKSLTALILANSAPQPAADSDPPGRSDARQPDDSDRQESMQNRTADQTDSPHSDSFSSHSDGSPSRNGGFPSRSGDADGTETRPESVRSATSDIVESSSAWMLAENTGFTNAVEQSTSDVLDSIDHRQLMDGRAESAPMTGPKENIQVDCHTRQESQPATDRNCEPAVAISDPGTTSEAERRYRSPIGGLVFLLHVVDEIGLPREIVNCTSMKSRSFAWVMYQLGLLLMARSVRCGNCAISEEVLKDPAILTFAGLSPADDPPVASTQPATDFEVCLLSTWRNRVAAGLKRRLNHRGGGHQVAQTTQELIDWVCGRRAEFVVDPGWTEVRFSLDDVSTELRRCGLDLDPGHIPWLGLVVKYVFA